MSLRSKQFYFDRDHAQKYGVDEAILLNSLLWWIEKNMTNNRERVKGKIWTYNSYNSFTKLFPFWTYKQMRRIVKSLVDQNVLVSEMRPGKEQNNGLYLALHDESEFFKITDEKSPTPGPDGQTPRPDGQTSLIYTDDNQLPVHSDNGQDPDNLFSQFYKAYPRKVKPDRALKAWNKHKLWRFYDDIMANIAQRMKCEINWVNCTGRDITIIPHPATYLNDKSWNDPLEVTHDKKCRVCQKQTPDTQDFSI